MFWRGVLGYLPVNVVQGVVGLLTIVTFTRLLTPAQFGDYALGFSVMSLAHTLIFTWNEAAMARFWAGSQAQDGGHRHTSAIYRTWVVLTLVLGVSVLVAALMPVSVGLHVAMLAGLCATLPRALMKLAQERRRAAGEVSSAAGLDMGMTLGGFGIGAVLAWRGLGGAAPLIGAGLAAVFALPFVFRRELSLASQAPLESERVRTHAAYGVPVALSLILALVLSSTDRFLLASFLNQEAVGLYHAGYGLANRTLDVVFIWLGAAGGPALVMALERGGKPALQAAAKEQAQLMALITLPAAVGLALVARPLAGLMIGGPLAAGAAHVTPWIALSGILAGLTTHYFHQAFTLGKRTRLLIVAMLVPAGANLVLNLILIPRFGLDGALWATPLSYGLGLLASAVLGRGVLQLPVPWKALAQAGAASLAMALVILLLPATQGLAELALKSVVGGVVYLTLVAAMDAGGLRSRSLDLLRARRQPSASLA